jgi:hypothetical protein
VTFKQATVLKAVVASGTFLPRCFENAPCADAAFIQHLHDGLETLALPAAELVEH